MQKDNNIFKLFSQIHIIVRNCIGFFFSFQKYAK